MSLLSAPVEPVPATPCDSFRLAMRNLAGAVSVITAGRGEQRVGMTATSVTSLALEPPSLLVCINRSSSTLPTLLEERCFGVNVLAGDDHELADRFAGRHRVAGAARYAGADWITLVTGASLLTGALAAFDCSLERIVDWHTHAIVIGKVEAVHIADAARPLVYWRGRYG